MQVKTIGVRLPIDVRLQVKKEAKVIGVSENAIIALAVNDFLSKREKEQG